MEKMLSDNTAVILGIVVFLLAWVTPLLSPLFRWRIKKEGKKEVCNLPSVSIIIASHDDAKQLEKHLPSLLQQDYPVQYEVIVVTEQGDHEVDGVLKRIQHTHEQQSSNAHLYVTYIPETSRYMSRRKLAITLGVKAAKNEWLLLTDSDCEPASNHWLAKMARNCEDTKTLIVGYACLESNTPAFNRYQRLFNFAYLARECRKLAYRTNCPNLMFRKSQFMNDEGYLGNLNLVRGEYDFIVNKFSQSGSTAVEMSPEAWIVQDEPTCRSWSNMQVYYMETRKSLLRSFPHRFLFNMNQLAMRVFVLSFFAAVVYSVLKSNWILLGISSFSAVIEFVIRYSIDRFTIKRFGEKIFLAVAYDHLLMWSNLYYLVRHRCANQWDFTTHKQ